MKTTKARKNCRRCAGRGEFNTYAHIWNGTCFRCHGTGLEPKIPSSITKKAEERWFAFCNEAYALYIRLGDAARAAAEAYGYNDPRAVRLSDLDRKAWARFSRRSGKYEQFVPVFEAELMAEVVKQAA